MLKRKSPLTYIRDMLYSAYFNFHYLPFHQAWKLPIRFHKPQFVRLKGKVRIEGPIHRHMIKLGYFQHGGYPDGGFMYENNGGEIVFKGAITFGGNSSFSIGKYGRLEIGGSTGSIEGFKVVCYHHIQIQNNCRIGWDVLMMDTSFHPLKNMDGTYTGTGVAPIIIGHDSWISTRCLVCPGAAMAPHSVLAANSMLNKSFDESYVLLAGSPATIKRRGIYRDMNDDRIDFEKYSILGK